MAEGSNDGKKRDPEDATIERLRDLAVPFGAVSLRSTPLRTPSSLYEEFYKALAPPRFVRDSIYAPLLQPPEKKMTQSLPRGSLPLVEDNKQWTPEDLLWRFLWLSVEVAKANASGGASWPQPQQLNELRQLDTYAKLQFNFSPDLYLARGVDPRERPLAGTLKAAETAYRGGVDSLLINQLKAQFQDAMRQSALSGGRALPSFAESSSQISDANLRNAGKSPPGYRAKYGEPAKDPERVSLTALNRRADVFVPHDHTAQVMLPTDRIRLHAMLPDLMQEIGELPADKQTEIRETITTFAAKLQGFDELLVRNFFEDVKKYGVKKALEQKEAEPVINKATRDKETAPVNDKPTTRTQSKPRKVTRTLKNDLKTAGVTLNGRQFAKLVREPLVALLTTKLGADKRKVTNFFKTPEGLAVIKVLLGAGLTASPFTRYHDLGEDGGYIADNYLAAVADAMRQEGMTDLADAAMDLVTNPLFKGFGDLLALITQMSNQPAPTPAELTAGPERLPNETVATAAAKKQPVG